MRIPTKKLLTQFSIQISNRSVGSTFDNYTSTDNGLIELFIRDYTGDAELLGVQECTVAKQYQK